MIWQIAILELMTKCESGDAFKDQEDFVLLSKNFYHRVRIFKFNSCYVYSDVFYC